MFRKSKDEGQQDKAEDRQQRQGKRLYVVHQALKDTNTASVYGTYQDRDAAQRAIEQARNSAGLTATREASYFLSELQVEAAPGNPDEDKGQDKDTKGTPDQVADTNAGTNTPVAGVTATDSGDALNAPNKQLADQDEDPHTRHLKRKR